MITGDDLCHYSSYSYYYNEGEIQYFMIELINKIQFGQAFD